MTPPHTGWEESKGRNKWTGCSSQHGPRPLTHNHMDLKGLGAPAFPPSDAGRRGCVFQRLPGPRQSPVHGWVRFTCSLGGLGSAPWEGGPGGAHSPPSLAFSTYSETSQSRCRFTRQSFPENVGASHIQAQAANTPAGADVAPAPWRSSREHRTGSHRPLHHLGVSALPLQVPPSPTVKRG